LNDASAENVPGEQQLVVAAALLLVTVCFAFACMKMLACSLQLPTQLGAVFTSCVKPGLDMPCTFCQSSVLHACLPARNSVCILHWVVASITNRQVLAGTGHQIDYIHRLLFIFFEHKW